MKRRNLFLLIALICCLQNCFSQNWRQHLDSATALSKINENGGALNHALAARDLLKKDSASTLSYFTACSTIGDIYLAMGQYVNAAPYYEEGWKLLELTNRQSTPAYALIQNNRGRLARLMGRYEEAETFLLASKNLRENLSGKENADYATSTNNLAILYVELGKYVEAAALYQEAKGIRERVLGKDHIDYAASCNNLAILYVLTGRPFDAEPLYLEAKRIRELALGKLHPYYAASCNNLAALYLDMGYYQKAEPLYLEAKEIRARTLGRQHPDYAASCDNLAILYMDIGRYEMAESLYREARSIREVALGVHHPEYAKGCNNLALLYKLLGQYERAAELFSTARSIFKEAVGTDHFEYAKCCNNLGAVYMDMGENEKAAALYTEARAIWGKVLGTNHPEYAKACHNLSLIYYRNGQYDEAVTLLQEANAIREKVFGTDYPDYAEGCDNLASIYLAKHDLEKAATLALQAKQIRERIFGEAHPDYLQSCINLANMYRSAQNDAMAMNLYTEAFSSQQALLQKIFRFTTEPEKQAYLKKVNEYRSYFLSFILGKAYDKGGVYAYEVSLANKNLVMNAARQLRQLINSTSDTALLDLYNEWIAAREQLAFWYTRPKSERKISIETLEERANRLEKQLTSASMFFDREQQESSWKNIQQSLHNGEAAIEFSSFQYFDGKQFTDSMLYFAVVIRKDREFPQLIRLFEKKQLEELLGARNSGPGLPRISYLYKYRAQVTGRKNSSLYSLVWQPVETALDGISTVYFSPSGDLHKLSFAAIPVSASEVLSDRYNLVQLTSTASITHPAINNTLQAPGNLQLYGGVQYDVDSISMRKAAMEKRVSNPMATRSGPDEILLPGAGEFAYLAASEKEVNEIGKLAREHGYQVGVNQGVQATEESIKAMNGQQSPTVLHIATHGFFFPDAIRSSTTSSTTGAGLFRESDNPLIRSGLALSGANKAWKGSPVKGIEDGILTAYEVSNMYLPNTQLAVLSACETGLGDIQGSEGVFGLQRAFRIAGVEHLVMSLWKVPDAETAEFMQEFYRQLFSNQTITSAFRLAQQFMKQKYRQDPFRWAAWVLVQ